MASAPDVTLVGVCDGQLDPKRHQTSYLTNKVGGQPDRVPAVPRGRPCCARCGAPSAHVVQVYCPLYASPYHRTLHLFACTGAECSGRSDTWTALRSQCLDESSEPEPEREAPPTATSWCDDADDWGEQEEQEEGGGQEEQQGGGGGGGGEQEVPQDDAAPEAVGDITDAGDITEVSGGLQGLCLTASQQDAPVLRPFFIAVVEESDLGGEEDELRHAQQLLRDYERREGVATGELEGGGGEEKYEKMRARHGDAVFSRFMKKISRCPQQILRYCRGGTPLFISAPPADLAAAVPACGSCGASRTFELQLMPALVSLLRRPGGGEAALEFGTVLLYSCSNSCWTSGASAAQEFCLVQTDPDQQLFR